MKYEIFIDKGCLVIKDETGFEYDPTLKQIDEKHWMNHMREKMWFTKELEDQIVKFLGKKVEDWDEWGHFLPRGSEERHDWKAGEIVSLEEIYQNIKKRYESFNR